MQNKLTGILASIKKMKPMDFVYPGILLVFFAGVAIIFFLSTQFISSNINEVFSTEQGGATQALDLSRYALAAKKLQIPVNTPGNETRSLEPVRNDGPVATSTTPVAEDTPTASVEQPKAPFDKSSLSVAVYNGTKTSGLAGKLKGALENAGFTVKVSGNKAGSYPHTTIEIKASAQPAQSQIEKIVGEQYETTTTIAPVDATYDVVIIIGAK